MAIKTHIRARKSFSFREHLKKQGVTTEAGIRYHLNFVAMSISARKSAAMKSCAGLPLNLRRYKVDPKNPNGGTYNG